MVLKENNMDAHFLFAPIYSRRGFRFIKSFIIRLVLYIFNLTELVLSQIPTISSTDRLPVTPFF